MKNVALCFSGHPRVFLEHASAWDQYFTMIRSRYNLLIFFHCWADQGLVPLLNGQYVEGQITSGHYRATQDLIDFLRPAAFSIESISPELLQMCSEFPPVMLSSIQASRKKILSQLYSINRADTIRQSFEASANVKSDVVVRVRFDATPQHLTLNEINYVAAHPEAKVLFAPSPVWHIHPGGGGGCTECHTFFDAHWLQDGFETRAQEFLAQHHRHRNDICDLFAVGSPETMRHYAQIYGNAQALNSQLQADIEPQVIHGYHFSQDDENPADRRISSASPSFDIENSPIFVPEKLIRYQMAGFLVVHGETVVVIQRR